MAENPLHPVTLLLRRTDLDPSQTTADLVPLLYDELRQIAAFYKTGLGKKIIENEPKALNDATTNVDNWATKFADEAMERMRSELKKKGHNL